MTIEALSGGQSLFQMMGASGAGRQGPPTGHDVAAKLNEAISSGHVDGAEFQSRLSDRFLARRMLRVFFRKTVRLILKNYPVFWKQTVPTGRLLARSSFRHLMSVSWCKPLSSLWKRVMKTPTQRQAWSNSFTVRPVAARLRMRCCFRSSLEISTCFARLREEDSRVFLKWQIHGYALSASPHKSPIAMRTWAALFSRKAKKSPSIISSYGIR